MNVVAFSARAKKGARTRTKMRGFRTKCATQGCFNSLDCAQPKCKACRGEDNRKKKDAVVRRQQADLIEKCGLGFADAPIALPMCMLEEGG